MPGEGSEASRLAAQVVAKDQVSDDLIESMEDIASDGKYRKIVERVIKESSLDEQARHTLEQWQSREIRRIADTPAERLKRAVDGEELDQRIIHAANRVIGELKGRIRVAEIKAEQGKDRLNPQLATGQQFNDRLSSSLENIEDNVRGPQKILVPVSIDVNGLKTINDVYGHEAGNKLLRDFGQAIDLCVRPDDVRVHFSGDEFGLLLDMDMPADMDSEKIDALIQQILTRAVKYIQENVERPDGLPVEMSIGYRTVTKKDQGLGAVDLFNDADQAQASSKKMSPLNGGMTASERIINFDKIEEIEGKIDTEQLNQAAARKGMERPLRLVLPKNCPAEIANRVLEEALPEMRQKVLNEMKAQGIEPIYE